MKQIFPKEIMDYVVQAYIPKNKVKSKLIYSTIVICILLALCSLPFLKVKIYSTSRGMIKPNKERVSLININSGKVLFSAFNANRYVTKGDTLLIIENIILDDQIALADYEKEQFSEELKDLKYLVENQSISLSSIHTPKYKKEYIQYKERLNEHITRVTKLKIDFDRQKKLFLKGVIAKAGFEDIELEYNLAQISKNQLKRQQLNSWQATHTELERKLKNLESNIFQFQKNKKEHILAAPISGTLINVIGVEKGSIIPSGTRLSQISPDSETVAECYINPTDIGLIRRDRPVSFQMDAYNYNQWGFSTGNIIAIAEDIELINNKPIFKVNCKINEQFLLLKNGAKGKITKGMTFSARFELTERTVFQLLYDKVDDWMNPGINNNLEISE